MTLPVSIYDHLYWEQFEEIIERYYSFIKMDMHYGGYNYHSKPDFAEYLSWKTGLTITPEDFNHAVTLRALLYLVNEITAKEYKKELC